MSILHHFQDITDYSPNFKEVTWPWPRPLEDYLSIWRLILHMACQCTKFEFSVFTNYHYEDIKGNAKCRIWGLGWFGREGVNGRPRSLAMSPFIRAHMTAYLTLIQTTRLSRTVFEL